MITVLLSSVYLLAIYFLLVLAQHLSKVSQESSGDVGGASSLR